jgi:dimethylaniline monooxygenase (N-oxide forming)
VVGVGNSGLDIAADLVPFADKVYTSARSPVLIMPRMMFGVPSARVMGKLVRPWMPWLAQRQIMRGLSRIYHGRMEDWGLQTPRRRTHPASNATFMSHVAYHKITIEPAIDEVRDSVVTFHNGDSIEVDTIIAATGYVVDLPFLSGDLAPVSGRRLEAYRRVVHPDWPGLYFVGFFNVSGGANIAMMDVQSQYLTAVVTGRLTLPSSTDMKADTAREFALMARRYPGSERYGLELDPFRYRKLVSGELGGLS